MKDNIIQVIKLVIVCVVAAAVLAMVYDITKEPIRIAIEQETIKAVKSVVTGYTDDMIIDTVTVTENGSDFIIYTVKDETGNIVGRSISTFSMNGYGGTMCFMLGVKPDNKISGIYVLSHKETPGLGTKMDLPLFKDQFLDKSLKSTMFKVKSDGGDIDAITSATITSRAVAEAVELGLIVLEKYFENVESDIEPDTLFLDKEEEVEDVN